MTRILTSLTAIILAAAVVTTLVLGAGASQSTAVPTALTAAASRAPAPAAEGQAAAVTARRSSFGRILFDGRGRALYLFTRERTKAPKCFGACAREWPPFLTGSRPTAGRGARGSLLGTTRRPDGSSQVTYRGHPLYYYVGDKRPGQILCQGVVQFGGRWLVVSPAGKAVH